MIRRSAFARDFQDLHGEPLDEGVPHYSWPIRLLALFTIPLLLMLIVVLSGVVVFGGYMFGVVIGVW